MDTLISPLKGCSQLRIKQFLTIYQGAHITYFNLNVQLSWSSTCKLYLNNTNQILVVFTIRKEQAMISLQGMANVKFIFVKHFLFLFFISFKRSIPFYAILYCKIHVEWFDVNFVIKCLMFKVNVQRVSSSYESIIYKLGKTIVFNVKRAP